MTEEVDAAIAAGLATADAEVARLKQAVEDEEKWRKLLQTVVDDVPEAPAAVCDLLTKQADVLGRRDDRDAELVRGLRDLYRQCSERAIASAKDSVRHFSAAAEAAGLEFDSSSRHPRYSLYDHAIEVELDERGLKATVSVQQGERSRMPLDVVPVVRRVKEEHDRLFGRDWAPQAFLASLKKAYKPLSKKGDKVPLRDLAAAMSKPRKPRLDEFSVDLGRLLRDPLAETGSTKVSVDQTRDTKNGLLLHGLQHSGYVLTLTMEERA